MKFEMIYRYYCELCHSCNKKILISRPFKDPSIANFLSKYYGGRIRITDFKDYKFEVALCNECGFIWQTNILDNKGMELLYSYWISDKMSLDKKIYADINFFKHYSEQVQEISILLKKNPFEINVLDFGMGWGFWCLMAKAHGYNVYGIEMSKQRIHYARNNGINVIDDLLKTNKNFDFINSNQVFEHVPDPISSLKVLAEHLKNDGIIKISVPNGISVVKENFTSDWQASKNAIHPLEHINCFNNSTLKLLADKANLKYLLGDGTTLYFTQKCSRLSFNNIVKLDNDKQEIKTNFFVDYVKKLLRKFLIR